ncbi:MAG: hypothetical protein H7A44_10675 [Opitutaceae bacterium]|nr:hypothetical protein [Opitutaceae bacterium]
MRRVLIVSPHFPPVNAPDMQRARIALPHFRALGWEPVVLAVTPESVEGAVLDPLFEKTYPPDIRIIRVAGIPSKFTRWLGIGSLWWRCGRALRKAGDRLLATEKFDLVFFTTTQFDVFTFGPRWLRRFGVHYVLDYQDPWINDYYRQTRTKPPGGWLRFGFSQFTARRREPPVVVNAAAIVSVSSRYNDELHARYPDYDKARLCHLPFGAAAADLAIARESQPSQPLVPVGDGRIHLVYTGRCGPDMERALRILFRALRYFRDVAPDEAARLHLHFIGTGYAPPPLGQNSVLPIAESEGVASQVTEICYRVAYFDALHALVQADALMVVGSDDPSYSASKIFPYLLARRPLLTIVHEESLMLKLAHTQNPAASFGFGHQTDSQILDTLAHRISDEWFVGKGWEQPAAGDLNLLEPHLAASMTRRLAAVFDYALQSPPA